MSDFKMPDLGGLMEAAQKMQAQVQRVQEELASKTVESTAGGGMVTATVNGRFELVKLTIDPGVVDPKDIEMLADLITAAVNQGVSAAREMSEKEMAKLTGGLNIPGMPGLPSM